MKAMAGQVWRNIYSVTPCSVLGSRDVKEFNNNQFLTHAYGWRPVFQWHNEHSEGEWNNFGCGFTILKDLRIVKPKKYGE